MKRHENIQFQANIFIITGNLILRHKHLRPEVGTAWQRWRIVQC